MKLIIKILFSVGFIASACAGDRIPVTGTELLHDCQTTLRAIDNNYFPFRQNDSFGRCVGYINGVLDSNVIYFCAAKNASIEQGIRIVVKYLRENPARLHESAALLMKQALQRAWPCKK